MPVIMLSSLVDIGGRQCCRLRNDGENVCSTIGSLVSLASWMQKKSVVVDFRFHTVA